MQLILRDEVAKEVEFARRLARPFDQPHNVKLNQDVQGQQKLSGDCVARLPEPVVDDWRDFSKRLCNQVGCQHRLKWSIDMCNCITQWPASSTNRIGFGSRVVLATNAKLDDFKTY